MLVTLYLRSGSRAMNTGAQLTLVSRFSPGLQLPGLPYAVQAPRRHTPRHAQRCVS